MTGAMQEAALARAAEILHSEREAFRERQRTRERVSSSWYRKWGRSLEPIATARMNQAIGFAIAMLMEVWEVNVLTPLIEDSRRRLERIQFLLNEYDLPAMERPRNRPLAAMPAPKPKPRPRPVAASVRGRSSTK